MLQNNDLNTRLTYDSDTKTWSIATISDTLVYAGGVGSVSKNYNIETVYNVLDYAKNKLAET